VTTYRIDLHCRLPELRFSRVALTPGGLERGSSLTYHATLSDAESVFGFGANEILVTKDALRAEMQRLRKEREHV
jgi:D-serine deaminase-like pyridoxal phosphate-dependent protein